MNKKISRILRTNITLFSLCLVAFVRELLGAGTVFGYPIPWLSEHPAILFILPPGAFLTLGFVIAAVQKIRNGKEDKERIAKLSRMPEREEKKADEASVDKEEATV